MLPPIVQLKMIEHYLGVLPRGEHEGLVTLLQGGDCPNPVTHGRAPLSYDAIKITSRSSEASTGPEISERS